MAIDSELRNAVRQGLKDRGCAIEDALVDSYLESFKLLPDDYHTAEWYKVFAKNELVTEESFDTCVEFLNEFNEPSSAIAEVVEGRSSHYHLIELKNQTFMLVKAEPE